MIQLNPLDARLKTEGPGGVRTQESADRDAQGRREQPEPEIKRHLSDAEFDESLAILKSHPSLVASGLVVRVEAQGDQRVIFIEDSSGQVIRRLSEADLWLLTRDKDRTTGRILDRAG